MNSALNWPHNQTFSQRSTRLRSYLPHVHFPSLLVTSPALKTNPHVITGHLYAVTLWLLAAIFRHFHPLNTFPSSVQITTSWRTTLCWRQPWSTKGSSRRNSQLWRWNILVRNKDWFLCFCCKSQRNWWYSCFSSISFYRVTFENLLPTRLLWFPSLRTPAAGVCTKPRSVSEIRAASQILFFSSDIRFFLQAAIQKKSCRFGMWGP